MSKKIFLPNAEQAGKLIDNAWEEFCDQMKESRMDFSTTPQLQMLVHDVFVAGYSYGHNDCLAIIRDQLSIDNWTNYTAILPKN